MLICVCCEDSFTLRDPDPWEGRMDSYCRRCALARCDAYPGECNDDGPLHPCGFCGVREAADWPLLTACNNCA